MGDLIKAALNGRGKLHPMPGLSKFVITESRKATIHFLYRGWRQLLNHTTPLHLCSYTWPFRTLMILFKRLNNTFVINKNLPRIISEERMPAC